MMPRRTFQPDAQMLTERTNRAGQTKTGDNGMDGHHVLAGASGTSRATDRLYEATERRRAARNIIRFARDDADRNELLDALALTWEQAAPLPADMVTRPKAVA